MGYQDRARYGEDGQEGSEGNPDSESPNDIKEKRNLTMREYIQGECGYCRAMTQ